MALIATGQLTIVDANDGLSASLSSNAAVLAAAADGTVASFAGAETQFAISEGGTDTTGLWSYYVSALGAGITYRDSDDGADRAATGLVDGGLGGENLVRDSENLGSTSWFGNPVSTPTSTPYGIATFCSLAKSTTATSEGRGTNLGSIAAGATITAQAAFMAGTSTSVSFGLRNAVDWGNSNTTAHIVSGPGALVNSGGLAVISGLSATEVTTVSVTQAILTTSAVSLYVYPGSHTSATIGHSTLVAAPQVQHGASAGEYAPTNGTARSGTRGYLKVTGLSQDLSYVDITATRLGQQSITRRYSVAKARTGSTGPTGQRGSITTSRAVTGTTWTDAEALTALTTLGAASAIAGDVVTLYNIAAGFVQSRRYSGSAWQTITAFFGGDAIVDGTIAGQKLADGAIGAAQMGANSVDTLQLAAGAVRAEKLAIKKHIIY